VCAQNLHSQSIYLVQEELSFYSPQFNCQLIFNFLMLSAQCISTTEPIPPAL